MVGSNQHQLVVGRGALPRLVNRDDATVVERGLCSLGNAQLALGEPVPKCKLVGGQHRDVAKLRSVAKAITGSRASGTSKR